MNRKPEGRVFRPFKAIPDPGAYFPARSVETARETLLRTLTRGEGVATVFGPAGSGKTLLLRLLASELELDSPVALLANFRMRNCRDLLAQILFELRISHTMTDESGLRLALHEWLRQTDYPRFYLLIDDAGRLGVSAFAELRSLLDVSLAGEPRFRIALAGAPTLEERLAEPRLAGFHQHVVSRAWLEPFTASETASYIARRLHETDGSMREVIFTPEAAERVHRLADGIPRVINQLCDLALWFGPDASPYLGASVVEKGWKTLQQLPDDRHQTPSAMAESVSPDANRSSSWGGAVLSVPNVAGEDGDDVIEFGTLDEEPGESVHLETTLSKGVSVKEPVSVKIFRQEQEEEEKSEDGTIDEDGELLDEEFEDDDTPESLRYDQIIRERLLGERSVASTPSGPAALGSSLSGPSLSVEPAEPPEPMILPLERPVSTDRRANYLEELRLLELEVSQEADLIRKIRNMHSGIESFRLGAELSEDSTNPYPTPSEEENERDSSRSTPITPTTEPKQRDFRSAFQKLYPDE